MNGRPLPLHRKLLFAAGVWLVFVAAAEGLLALAGVEPSLEREDPYVGFAERIPLFVPAHDEHGREVFETAPNKLRFFNPQRFAARKPAGTRRIFCVGGSTTYGRPYSDATSFCGWLRELLPAVAPESDFEVVNAGGISYASYRVASLMQELAGYEPDVFVVYTGHNEFLEERTYAGLRDANPIVRRLESAARHTRIDAALRGLATRLGAGAEREQLGAEVSTLLDRSVGPAAYERDDALRERVLDHYRFNLERIVAVARRVGAEPLLVVPASNLRSCSPFKGSFSDSLDAGARARWQQAMERGRDRLAHGDAGAARDAFAEAVALDPRHADGHYGLGQSQLLVGEMEAAVRSLARARDEDVCPLRALSAMGGIVLEVAREQEVAVVDFEEMVARDVQAAQGHRAPGEDWFLDHVHPTIEGHRRLAVELLAVLANSGWLPPRGQWSADRLEAVRRRVLDSLDTGRQGLALRNLAKVLSWAGKSEDAARLASQALEKLGEDAECRFILGVAAAEQGRWEEAATSYRRAIAREPEYLKAHNNLGTALARLGRDDEAIAHYEIVLAADPGHTSARFNLANALLRGGQPAAAGAHYLEVLRTDPDDVDARFNLARSYARRGDWSAAADAYREVLAREPEDSDAAEELAAALGQLEGRRDR